jgi:hypothetical protein
VKDHLLGAGKSVTYEDVLFREFGQTSAWGAILVKADTNALAVSSQTSTPAASGVGTYGLSVPGAAPMDLIVNGLPRSILAVRQDAKYRTNLVLANAAETSCDVDVTLVLENGTALTTKRYTLLPLAMTQINDAPTLLGATGDVFGARIVVSTPTTNGSFAAYCACIDNRTGDPRALLPR